MALAVKSLALALALAHACALSRSLPLSLARLTSSVLLIQLIGRHPLFALPYIALLGRDGLIQRFFSLILCSLLLVHVIYSLPSLPFPSPHRSRHSLAALHVALPKFKVFAAQFIVSVFFFFFFGVVVCADFASICFCF